MTNVIMMSSHYEVQREQIRSIWITKCSNKVLPRRAKNPGHENTGAITLIFVNCINILILNIYLHKANDFVYENV